MDDLRFAVRGLLKAPGFSAVALATLTLGLAASAAGFSILYAVLLRPLPYPASDRLVTITGRGISTTRFEEWRQASTSYDAFAAVDPGVPNVDTPDGPERIQSLLVSRDFFPMLALRPTAGRVLGGVDFDSGSPSVIVTDRLAARLFGSAAAAIGREVHLVGTGYVNERYVVVGTIASTGPLSQGVVSLIMPLLPLPRGELCPAIGRLKPGVTLAAARSEATSLAAAFAGRNASRPGAVVVQVEGLQDHVLGASALALRLMFAASILVLLISCANVTHLVLARSVARTREAAVRLALGASRGRLARGLFWESLFLSAGAAAIGLWLSSVAVRALIVLAPYRVPRIEEAHTSAAVILFTAVLALATSLAFVLGPLVSTGRVDLNSTLRSGARQLGGSRRLQWFRSLLVSAEIAVACVVLVIAGLLVETFATLRPSNPGFNPEHKLILRIGNTAARNEDSIALVADLQARIGSMPGVREIAAATDLPLTGLSWVPDVSVGGRQVAGGPSPDAVHVRAVTSNYFSTLQTPIAAGRDLDKTDMAQRLSVAVVNQEFVRRFLPGTDPLGQRVSFRAGRSADDTFDVVGVARDARLSGDSAASRPELYIPFTVAPARGFYLVIETSGDPASIAAQVRSAVHTLAPGAVITGLLTMTALLRASVAEPRFHASLLGILAMLAVLLALAGMYAVMSYSVAQRRHEMGVRIALGADVSDILSLVLRRSLRQALAGLAVGLPAAFVVSRTMTTLLYGTTPADPRSYASAAAGLLLLAIAAALAPAARAARVSPIEALRDA